MTDKEFRLECLKLVWPAGHNPDPAHYIAKAEVLLRWVLSGGETGTAAPAPQPTEPAQARTHRKAPALVE